MALQDLTSQGVAEQDTVRGKIMVNQADSSRIGGGITEYIEQLADINLQSLGAVYVCLL